MTKHRLAFLILLILVQLSIYAQIKISGHVTESDSTTPIEFVNVALLKQDSTFLQGTATDQMGIFSFKDITSGNYILSVSFMGYEHKYITIKKEEKDIDLNNIAMQTSTVALSDITITANAVINKSDRKLITPSQTQINSSSNGLDLLKKLQLPRININPLDNSVSTSGNGTVQLRINGVQVTNAEVTALRPEDIVRVEFHDDPGVRYGNAAAVIDYITIRKVSGGNVNGDFMNDIVDNIGFAEDNFAAKYNHKKSEFAVNTYYHHRKIDWTRENEEKFIFPNKELHRIEKGEPTLLKENYLNTALTYNLMEKDKYFFNTTFRYNYQDDPNEYSDRIGKIITSDNPVPLSIYDHSSSKSNSPALDLYYQRNLKNDQLLIFNIVGTYINSQNERTYKENRGNNTVTDIYSDISGNKYSLIGEGIYERKIGEAKLTGGIKHVQTYTNNEYKGSTIADISMRQAESYMYGEYQLKKGKFNYMANLSVIRFYYSQGQDAQKKYTLQPSVRIGYNPNDDVYFRYRFNVWNHTPSLANLNNVEQAIDSLQIRRGNPGLKTYQSYNNTLTAGYKKGIFSADLYTMYSYQNKPVMESIIYENNMFIRTYENQKAYHRITGELTLKLKPWKDYITLTAAPAINRYISIGNNYTHTYTNERIRLSIDVMYKNWVANIEYQTPWDYVYGESLNSGEKFHTAIIGYVKPNWSVMAGAFNLFGGTYERKDKNWSHFNPVNSNIYTKNLTQLFFVKCSFNINFGRQYSSDNKRLNNNDSDSGVMKGSK